MPCVIRRADTGSRAEFKRVEPPHDGWRQNNATCRVNRGRDNTRSNRSLAVAGGSLAHTVKRPELCLMWRDDAKSALTMLLVECLLLFSLTFFSNKDARPSAYTIRNKYQNVIVVYNNVLI